MSKLKMVGIAVGILALPLFLGLWSVGVFSVVEPLREDAKREVFENTQSYVHGKVQTLAKLKLEYDKADNVGKAAIRSVIVNQFAEFDDRAIRSDGLRNFLVQVRGF